MAGGMLFLSVVVDAVQEILPISYGASQAFEEGFKFLGAAAWAYFCFRCAAWRLKGLRQPRFGLVLYSLKLFRAGN